MYIIFNEFYTLCNNIYTICKTFAYPDGMWTLKKCPTRKRQHVFVLAGHATFSLCHQQHILWWNSGVHMSLVGLDKKGPPATLSRMHFVHVEKVPTFTDHLTSFSRGWNAALKKKTIEAPCLKFAKDWFILHSIPTREGREYFLESP